MKRILLPALFLLAGVIATAQSADSVYALYKDSTVVLTTNTNATFEGKINSTTNYVIGLDTKTGHINFPFHTVKQVASKAGTVLFIPPPEPEKKDTFIYALSQKRRFDPPDSLFNSKPKYEYWNKCGLIHGTDTTWVKAEPRQDYGANKKLFTVVNKQGQQLLGPNEIDHMVIYYDGQPSLYASGEAEIGKMLYHVMVGGKCELLFGERVRRQNVGGGMIAAGRGDMVMGFPGMSEEKDIVDSRWAVCYKGKFSLLKWQEHVEETKDNTFNLSFKDKCKEIFGECPSLVTKINADTYTESNLQEIVIEFNDCLASKK